VRDHAVLYPVNTKPPEKAHSITYFPCGRSSIVAVRILTESMPVSATPRIPGPVRAGGYDRLLRRVMFRKLGWEAPWIRLGNRHIVPRPPRFTVKLAAYRIAPPERSSRSFPRTPFLMYQTLMWRNSKTLLKELFL
jgi:hypothetical protein